MSWNYGWLMLCLALLVDSGLTQSTPRFICSTNEPRTDREFNEWIRSDVRWLVTNAERTAFANLKSGNDRREFVQNFWRRRDPDPDTSANEFRDTYCGRLPLTKRFESGIPGWKTDRGRILLLWGEPDKILTGKENIEGDVVTVFEKWTYKHLDDLGTDIYVTFVDPTQTKEFRFAKSDLGWLDKYFADAAMGLRSESRR